MSDALSVIRERQSAIAAQIAAKRDEIAALEAERDRNAQAYRTVADLLGIEVEDDLFPQEAAEERSYRRNKPEGIPSMPEMIAIAIRDAAARGVEVLEPKDMQRFIQERWWPDVKLSSVGPIAWRLAQEGRLTKEGSSYGLPKDEAPADERRAPHQGQ